MGMSAQEIDKLVALNVPILCLDTCSILDTMRDPTRDGISEKNPAAALFLLAKMKSDAELVGLIAPQVEIELDTHVQSVEDEATKALCKLKARLVKIDAIAAVFGATGKSDLSHLDDHVTQARAAVDRMIACGMTFHQSQNIANKALIRMNQARTPAKHGKDSMKDCVVIETYLSAIANLRSAGWKAKAVFVSSNTKDYRGETGANLKPDLAKEFAAIGMEYAADMGTAKFLLGFR